MRISSFEKDDKLMVFLVNKWLIREEKLIVEKVTVLVVLSGNLMMNPGEFTQTEENLQQYQK